MYDFVDRPVAALNPGGRFLVRAMRGWVAAVADRTCPSARIEPAFATWNMIGALPHFHMTMTLLNRDGLDMFRFASIDHAFITEDEAVLLQLFRTIQERPADQLAATCALIVTEDAAGPLRVAFAAVALHLAKVGLTPRTFAFQKPGSGYFDA